MKLRGDIKINGKLYPKGSEISGLKIYPFFLFHMLAFGLSGFVMAYSDEGPPALFLYLFGGIATLSYIIFYLTFFGRDEVKWMFINSALGLFGIYTEINWILSYFNKSVADYPFSVHLIPFLFYILYTFLIRQALTDLTHSRENIARRKIVDQFYVTVSTLLYTYIYFANR